LADLPPLRFYKKMKEPPKRSDGTCSACHGRLCAFHQKKTAEDWDKKQELIRSVAKQTREAKLDRIMARFELESDEFLTARQKAECILMNNPHH